MQPESDDNLRLEIGHVLFIDIVGYSRLLIEEQKERLNQLTEIVLATSQVLESTDEQLVRLPTGDGMALVFHHSAEEPARCALEIAEALQKHPELPVRMGIHSGPVSEVRDVSGRSNIAGAGINMAQRVMDCGDAGHILLSQHVADDLVQYRQWAPRLHDLGDCEVKHGVRLHVFSFYNDEVGNSELPTKFKSASATTGGVPARRSPRPLLLLAAIGLVVAVVAFWLVRKQDAPAVSTAPDKSIAVLPFQNLSSDKENAYFADGIQDEILTRLSKIADLKVISRTSTQHYKSTPENLPDIAKQLGVAHILEGSVQKSGDSVRVNVQLIKAANDSHLWADTYDRRLTDIFSVESDVARAIADQLQAKLTGQEEQVIAARPTESLEAYDAYLRGLAYTLKTAATTANALGSQKHLKEAVRLDPRFALAWALLSAVDSRGYITASLEPTVALKEEARQAVETALTLQPELGEAILAQGSYQYGCVKDYDAAARYFEQARSLLPNSSRIPESLAYVARRRGQWERSESYFKEAERLDPRNVTVLTQHALSYISLHRFPEAQRNLDQVLDITPDDVDAIAYKGSIGLAEGDLSRASALLTPLRAPASDNIVWRIQTYAAILERKPSETIARLKEILTRPDPAQGYHDGELRFWLGWAQQVGGDPAAAQESWRAARAELEPLLKEQPGNYRLIQVLALTDLGLGDKAAALTMADRAIIVNPLDKDAVAGPQSIEVLARVAAGTGQSERAIAALEQLLSIASGGGTTAVPLTPAVLRLDPMFDPLRSEPRFQKLCEDK
ncbi:MAG: tetratricopeptide repeat protein [Chthoniobacterales bacterium]